MANHKVSTRNKNITPPTITNTTSLNTSFFIKSCLRILLASRLGRMVLCQRHKLFAEKIL